MARDADHDGSAGVSAILSRVDPYAWVPVASMLVAALASWLLLDVPLLGLLLVVIALVIFGFDLWVNSRASSGGSAARLPRMRRRQDPDDDEFDRAFGQSDSDIGPPEPAGVGGGRPGQTPGRARPGTPHQGQGRQGPPPGRGGAPQGRPERPAPERQGPPPGAGRPGPPGARPAPNQAPGAPQGRPQPPGRPNPNGAPPPGAGRPQPPGRAMPPQGNPPQRPAPPGRGY